MCVFFNKDEFKCKSKGLFEALETHGDQVSSYCCDGDGGDGGGGGGGGEEIASTHRAFSMCRAQCYALEWEVTSLPSPSTL